MNPKIKMLLDMQRLQYGNKIPEEDAAQLFITPSTGQHFVFVFTESNVLMYKFEGDSKGLITRKEMSADLIEHYERLCDLQNEEIPLQLDGTSATIWRPHSQPEYIKLSIAIPRMSDELEALMDKFGEKAPWLP